MRILVVDQCSGSKDVPDNTTLFQAEDIDERSRESLLEQEGVPGRKARDLYIGRQQQCINSAVDSLRADGHAVDRLFISAGFGLVDEETRLPPYEVTFAEMTVSEIRERADCLRLTKDLVEHIQSVDDYDIVFFSLGSDYYRALGLDTVLAEIAETTFVVVFNQEELAEGDDHIVSIPARTAEAKAHGTIVVSLKGKYLEYFAEHVSEGKSVKSVDDLREYCTTETTSQQGLDQF